MEEERLRDLPTPKFWEDDIVETADGRIAKVGVVRYGLLDDEEFPPYMLLKGDDLVVDKNGVPEEFFSADLKLIERGNIFHFFNGNPCTFGSVEEEAHFHYHLGLVEHVSNPISGHFGFSHHQAIAALEAGTIDMIFVDACHPIDGIHTCFCYRINDRELADRARKVNLAGLELAQTVGIRK